MQSLLSRLLPRRRWALAVLVGLLVVGCADTAERSDQTTDELRAPAEWMALPDVRRASYALQDAAARVEETDARLARQMAQIGLALTDEQRQRYATAFFALPDVSETHRSFITAAGTLDRELGKLVSTHLAEVMRTVWGGVLSADHYGPSELYADYKLLAGSPVATGALAFAVCVAAKDRAYANVRVSREQVESEILGPALPAALVEQRRRDRHLGGWRGPAFRGIPAVPAGPARAPARRSDRRWNARPGRERRAPARSFPT